MVPVTGELLASNKIVTTLNRGTLDHLQSQCMGSLRLQQLLGALTDEPVPEKRLIEVRDPVGDETRQPPRLAPAQLGAQRPRSRHS